MDDFLGEDLSFEEELRIARYEEKALAEERSGCFGLAEHFWKQAYAAASRHFPEDLARIAKNFGLFLKRFLPESAQPITYLRTAAALEALQTRCFNSVGCSPAVGITKRPKAS